MEPSGLAAWRRVVTTRLLLRRSIKQGFEAAWARQPEYRGAVLRRDAATASEAAAQRWTPEPPALELTAKGDRLTSKTGAREYEAKVASLV